MKLVLLSIVFCFGTLNAQEFNTSDSNLTTGTTSTTEGDFADITGIHQNAQRSYGTVPSANCPGCAFAQQLSAHELNPVELGATPGSNGTGSTESDGPAKQQK